MEYVYAALLLHYAKQEINEDNLTKVLSAAGLQPDEVRVKAVVNALREINIEDAIKSAMSMAVAAPAAAAPAAAAAAPAQAQAAPAEQKPAEEKKEGPSEEEIAGGLGALFG